MTVQIDNPAAGPEGGGFVTDYRTVSDQDVRLFAALSGDHHPQHLDEEWCRTSLFGERIAHGMLVLSLATGLVPLDPERVVALRRMDCTFKAPVRLGDQIRVEGRFKKAKPIDAQHQLVTFAWILRDGHGRAVARADVDVVWREPAPAPVDESLHPIPGVVPL